MPPTISVRLGMTVKVPDTDFTVVKPEVSFDGLDPNNLEADLAMCEEAALKAIDRVAKVASQEAADAAGMGFAGFGLNKEIKVIRQRLRERFDALDEWHTMVDEWRTKVDAAMALNTPLGSSAE